MRWGKVKIRGSFFLMAAWLNYLDRQQVFPLVLLSCLFHELGHYWAILALGGNIRLVRLTAVGAEMSLSGPLGYWREGVAALAGPGVNLALALIFCRWEWGAVFAGLNLALACFNLMPVIPLDGGRAADALLAMLFGPEWGAGIMRLLEGTAMTLLLGVGAVLWRAGGSVTLLFTALWLVIVGVSVKKNRIRACHTGGKQVK